MPDDDKKDHNPLLEVKDGGYPRGESASFLRQFLDPNGHNFLGSGLSAIEWNATADFLRYDRCFTTQPLEERRRRMHYVIKLAAEQERLVERDRFATRHSELVIESVIDGDWKAVKMWTEGLLFKDEPSVREVAAKNFAKFVEIATEAYETRPKVFCPVCRKPPPEEKLASWRDGRHLCPRCDVVFDGEGNFQEKARANLQTIEGGE